MTRTFQAWFFLDTGANGAAVNMATDEVLLALSARLQAPILRVYGWLRPAVSLGYFQKWSPALAQGRELVRRPTGGGRVEHGDGFTYSLVLPLTHPLAVLPTRELYREIHEAVRGALPIQSELALRGQGRRDVCFAEACCYDLVADGRKIAGAALRRGRDGILTQGEVKAPLCGNALQRAMVEQFSARFEPFSFLADFRDPIERLAREKYASEGWTKKFAESAPAFPAGSAGAQLRVARGSLAD